MDGYLNRKKFIQCEEVHYEDLKIKRIVYINPEKIITVVPTKRHGLDLFWVQLEGEKDKALIKGDAEEFLYDCKIDIVEFEGFDIYDELNATKKEE